MKRTYLIIFSLLLSMSLSAQDMSFDDTDSEDTEMTMSSKHEVYTNSFWSNWFFQGGVMLNSFYSNQEKGCGNSQGLYGSLRSGASISLALGKWFTPGLALRTSLETTLGKWGKQVNDGYSEKFAYYTLNEQLLLNVTNLFWGYKSDRLYNFIPFAGASLSRNMTCNQYALGLSFGLLNTFRVSDRVALNFELGYSVHESDFDGGGMDVGTNVAFAAAHDRKFYIEAGVTVNLGKKRFNHVPDIESIRQMQQAEIDALNAQVNDLMQELEEQKKDSVE